MNEYECRALHGRSQRGLISVRSPTVQC